MVVKKYKNANQVGWKKDEKKSKNDNRVDSFIWHLRVGQINKIDMHYQSINFIFKSLRETISHNNSNKVN